MAELRTIDVDDDGIRIDRWFKRHYPNVTHVLLEKLLRKQEGRGQVFFSSEGKF